MEFNFNVNELLKCELAIITKDLVPHTFAGDHRAKIDCASKMSKILDEVGVASAKAQGLQKAITSGQKLNDSEQILYLLMDPGSFEGKGSVVGLLKIGRKKLFMFDLTGYQHEVEPLCILDFYVHESKQRTGCGKKLFEFMLQHQNVLPQHLAIDKPSDKFLSFLLKHYGLENIFPQMNNFVIFDGFFEDRSGERKRMLPCDDSSSLQVTRKFNCQLSTVKSTDRNSSVCDLTGRCTNFRFAASKPESTMGMILQDCTVGQGNQRSEVRDALNGSSDNEHSTYLLPETQSTLNSTSCPVDFVRQKTVVPSISEENKSKSLYKHSDFHSPSYWTRFHPNVSECYKCLSNQADK